MRGIKPRFGSTTEILQQIQNQLQPPAAAPPATTATRTTNTTQVSWPYYSETNIAGMDNTKQRNANIYQYEDAKKNYMPHYRPTSLIEESVYQNCAYRTNVNHVYAPVGGGGCGDYYHQSLPRNRNGRPQSPPPLDVSKNYHQTMVYIPYNHIEGYQPPNPYYAQNEVCYTRVSNQNQINKRYIDPAYANEEQHHYPLPPPKHLIRVSYSSQMGNRSESPLPGQFLTARSTQTPCNYYPVRYRPVIGPWQTEPIYAGKVNRHSYPARFPPPDDTDTQSNLPLANDYRQTIDSIPNSPTKPRFIERGVPEGAASVSPQDVSAQTASTMTSPTSPQQGKPLFYAMNV